MDHPHYLYQDLISRSIDCNGKDKRHAQLLQSLSSRSMAVAID